MGSPCADSDVTCIELFHDLLHRYVLANNCIAFDLDSKVLHGVDLHLDDVFGKTEFRDTVNKNSACGMKGFEYRYFIALLGKIPCYCQTGGS